MQIPVFESFIYSHWMIVMRLLEIGIPYHDILELEEHEINIILGIQAAIDEKRQQDQGNG